jgi:hypothetical protein
MYHALTISLYSINQQSQNKLPAFCQLQTFWDQFHSMSMVMEMSITVAPVTSPPMAAPVTPLPTESPTPVPITVAPVSRNGFVRGAIPGLGGINHILNNSQNSGAHGIRGSQLRRSKAKKNGKKKVGKKLAKKQKGVKAGNH